VSSYTHFHLTPPSCTEGLVNYQLIALCLKLLVDLWRRNRSADRVGYDELPVVRPIAVLLDWRAWGNTEKVQITLCSSREGIAIFDALNK
jgi:hypothetical protein